MKPLEAPLFYLAIIGLILGSGCALKRLPSQALKTATKAIETAGKVVETTGKVVVAGSQTAGKAIGLAEKVAEVPGVKETVLGAVKP